MTTGAACGGGSALSHALPALIRCAVVSYAPLIGVDESGLICAQGGFRIDPSKPADCAVVTHAHIDHACRGSRLYVAARSCVPVLRARLGKGIRVQPLEYGERTRLGEVWVSLHPAGHVLGSAQVRVEGGGRVWVVTGDFKRDADPSCEPFELVPCDTLITEGTFGLPQYSWEPAAAVVQEIRLWWEGAPERPSLLFCYALGKTQRVLAELARLAEPAPPVPQAPAASPSQPPDRPVYLHGEAVRITEVYRRAGIRMVPAMPLSSAPGGRSLGGALVIAPPSAPYMRRSRRLRDAQTAFVSGWMQSQARRARYDRGFALSDHADWAQLVATVRESGARTVYVTHGESRTLAAHLRDSLGIEAHPLTTLGPSN